MQRDGLAQYPGRFEAEAATLEATLVTKVDAVGAASGDGAVEGKVQTCTATSPTHGTAGRYDVVVQYFDVNTGTARYRCVSMGRRRRSGPPTIGCRSGSWMADSSNSYVLRNVR